MPTRNSGVGDVIQDKATNWCKKKVPFRPEIRPECRWSAIIYLMKCKLAKDKQMIQQSGLHCFEVVSLLGET